MLSLSSEEVLKNELFRESFRVSSSMFISGLNTTELLSIKILTNEDPIKITNTSKETIKNSLNNSIFNPPFGLCKTASLFILYKYYSFLSSYTTRITGQSTHF